MTRAVVALVLDVLQAGAGHRMSAVILAFPCPSQVREPAPFTAAWCAQHVRLIDAAVDLLAADDKFAQRCRLMADAEARAMLNELAGQLARLGADIEVVATALCLTAARIRDGMLAPA